MSKEHRDFRFSFVSRVRQPGRLAWVDTYELAFSDNTPMLTRNKAGKLAPVRAERVVPMREGKTDRDRKRRFRNAPKH